MELCEKVVVVVVVTEERFEHNSWILLPVVDAHDGKQRGFVKSVRASGGR